MYRQLEKKLKINFKNKKLLIKALTHRSYLNEHPDKNLISNERLEFLGDAVLEFLVSHFFYLKFPDYSEGQLTRLRSKLVCDQSLARVAQKLNLGQYLLLGRGEELSGGRKNPSLLSNTFEALLGAIYLDQGLKKAKEFVKKHLFSRIEKIKKIKDYKSDFQIISQEKFKITPTYKTLKTTGPAHNRCFSVGVFLKNKLWGRGEGKSKQEAAQKAAKQALAKVKSD